MINAIGSMLELFSGSVFAITLFTALMMFAVAGYKVISSLLKE